MISWEHVQVWEHFTVGCIIHDFIYPFQRKIVLLTCLVQICEAYAHSPFSIFSSSLVQCWPARLDILLLWSLLRLTAFALQLQPLLPFLQTSSKVICFFRIIFSSVSGVCSMMSLLTPCKSLADQTNMSLFFFRNYISSFSSSGLRWALIVTALSGISSK
jgi:hypothetical protein